MCVYVDVYIYIYIVILEKIEDVHNSQKISLELEDVGNISCIYFTRTVSYGYVYIYNYK